MLKTHHRFFRTLFQVNDLLIVAFAWFVSYFVRFHLLMNVMPVTKGIPIFREYLLLTLAIVIIWFLGFSLGGVYKSRRTQSLIPEILIIARSSLICFLILVAGAYFLLGDLFSRGVLLCFFGLSLVFLVIERSVIRGVLKSLRRRGFNQRHALIVGDNAVGLSIVERLTFHPELGIKIRGVLSVPASHSLSRAADPTSGAVSQKGIKVLGSVLEIAEILEKYDTDHLILAMRNSEQNVLDELLSTALNYNVDIRIVPDLHQFLVVGCEVEEFEGLPLITLNQSPIVGWDGVAKRTSDMIYASFALLVFSPFMLLIAVAIKVFTPGPVFYRQPRVGLDGRVFDILKFRSMRVDAEAGTGAVWAQKGDDRVTWLGRFLRKTSLDELPQFINVLRGDMSCVGPRPERPELVQRFKRDIPRYMFRHKVKAGITGWAQVNGWRGNTSLQERIECDLFYISNWSLFFDFKIIVMTVFKSGVSKNAY